MSAKEYYDESYVATLLEEDKVNHQTSATDSKPSKTDKNYLDTAIEAAEEFNKEFDGLFDG